MNPIVFTLEAGNSRVTCHRFGYGPRVLIAFHGYGETGAGFGMLDAALGAEFTIYAPDLPFHGQTQWDDNQEFTIGELEILVGKIIDAHPDPSGEKFSLLGFSLGGRLALQTYELFPGQVDRLLLLAPDGLKVNPWYWLATQTYLGNRLFSFTMKKPAWFFRLLRLFNRAGLVNPSVYKFVKYYIGSTEARTLLYQRWTGLRHITPHLSQIQEYVRIHQTKVRIIYGLHDRIILPARGYHFAAPVNQHVIVSVIDAGHQVLHPRHADMLLTAFID